MFRRGSKHHFWHPVVTRVALASSAGDDAGDGCAGGLGEYGGRQGRQPLHLVLCHRQRVDHEIFRSAELKHHALHVFSCAGRAGEWAGGKGGYGGGQGCVSESSRAGEGSAGGKRCDDGPNTRQGLVVLAA